MSLQLACAGTLAWLAMADRITLPALFIIAFFFGIGAPLALRSTGSWSRRIKSVHEQKYRILADS